MQYRQLGQSGLLVSELTLGTLPFGGRDGFEKCGEVDVPGAKRMFDIAIEAGVNLIDTADLYSHGLAEEVVGLALGSKRDDILLATKARSPMDSNPNNSGASRYHLIRACEASLERLGTDRLDLYQLHNWDGLTPIEESLEAMDHLVRAGKVRYFGTSNFTAWQMMKTLGKAELHGFIRPVTQQIYYTPESREAEYELLPLALDQSVGTLVWAPLGEGLLSGSVRRGQAAPRGTRQGDEWPEPYVHDPARALDIIETLAEIGQEHDVSVARVCLAWLKDRPGITSLIFGARNESQLRDNLAAAELQLSAEQRQRIEQASRRQPLYPYWHRIVSGMDRIDPAEQPFLDEQRQTLKARKDRKDR